MSSTIRAAGLGLALLIGLSAGTALAQPPGGRPGGGRPDPAQFFDMMAQGKSVITRDQLAPQFQGMFDRFAQRMGITDGKMTRQQFTDYMAQRAAQRAQRGQGGPGGSGG